MLLKDLASEYFLTIRDHLKHNSTLCPYLIQYSASSLTSKISFSSPLNFPEGISEEKKIFLCGVSEFYLKFLIAAERDEDFLDHEVLRNQVLFFNEFLLAHGKAFLSILGSEIYEKLKKRSEFSLSEGFDYFSEGNIQRSLFLFSLSRLFKRQELFWFKYDSLSAEEEAFVESITSRAMKIMKSFRKSNVDYFPVFGESDLKGTADLLIGDKVFCFLSSFFSKEHVNRQVAILRACEFLDKESRKSVIKHKYIYNFIDSKLFYFR